MRARINKNPAINASGREQEPCSPFVLYHPRAVLAPAGLRFRDDQLLTMCT